MTLKDEKTAEKLRNLLPTAIRSYHRDPSAAKLRIILYDATRLRTLEGDYQYMQIVNTICTNLRSHCNDPFVTYIDNLLLTQTTPAEP